jgi:hypothetical protein
MSEVGSCALVKILTFTGDLELEYIDLNYIDNTQSNNCERLRNETHSVPPQLHQISIIQGSLLVYFFVTTDLRH